MEEKRISATDTAFLGIIRRNVSLFLQRCADAYDRKGLLLDIAPQDHEGASPYFKKAEIRTLDINPVSGATYIADLCECNRAIIPDSMFDLVVCTEVLEHSLNPFSAAREIHRILKAGGYAFITTPFNFRIHGPLPDCWRFTEHGLKSLLSIFRMVELSQVDDENRWLMPIHYSVIVQKEAAYD